MTIDPAPATTTTFDPLLLKDLCREVEFAVGAKLRTKGLLYADMYLLTEGEVDVALDTKASTPSTIRVPAGSPIGEISFLTGMPATATVTAATPVRALFINNRAWRELERKHPQTSVDLSRKLAEVAEGRLSQNLLFTDTTPSAQHQDECEVILCRTPQQLLNAQRLRYEIYCEELGRTSPYADHEKKIIEDDLDTFGHILLALEKGEPVGTLRVNSAREGVLGSIEQLYGMADSPFHPDATSVCTKFIVKKSHRLGKASFKMMATALEFSERFKVKQCFIDCIPQLLPFYKTLGFAAAGPAFLHPENGRSYPLMLDVDRYAKRIARLTGFAIG